MESVTILAQKSKKAALKLSSSTLEHRNNVLKTIAQLLLENKDEIVLENSKDLEQARFDVHNGLLSESLLKRLDISNDDKFDLLIQGIEDVIKLEDPIGECTLATRLDDGLDLYRVSCPVGVLLIIFEARPEVVVQISCLALKSGNSVILKGGKEASRSNNIIHKTIQQAISQANLANIPETCVQLVSTRDEISLLLSLDKYIDLVIPRGSNALVKTVQSNTRIPVLGHADGICSIYVDESASLDKAVPVIVDAKTSYPAACNSVETLLINSSALSVLDGIANELVKNNVELRCDSRAYERLGNLPKVILASESDFESEFLDLTIAIKCVDSLEEAIDHINEHGSHHTDCIISECSENAKIFMNSVDSAGVYWNASTRFADGFRYGFGAEIGVSTNKTHARGPVGLEGLMIYKYKLYGNGHFTGMFASGKKKFLHEEIKF